MQQRFIPRVLGPLAVCAALLGAASAVLPAWSKPSPDADRKTLTRERDSLKGQISDIRRDINRKEARLDAINTDLRKSEQAISRSSRTLKELSEQKKGVENQLSDLRREAAIVGEHVKDAEGTVALISRAQYMNTLRHPWQTVLMGGKQCALLAPTTLLAWQHYNTLLSRMEAFPVKIGMLSRFRTAKQQKETLRGLQAGSVDIVVGTHRLLSKDVKFHDLGLVIIDEEQRFGVKHKEKLKENFIGVDMLTLSATPIPRTLNMAMSGIRDLSTIEQPPIERQPVETFVLEYNDVILAEAMKKELARGGQVYYLHNRVDNIEACAAHVSQMVPGARVGIAHGKMTEEELNPVWQHLLNGEIDILVCTTLIETGIDVRNCNTLIIEDADRMGLAQLYQIRGRVGRSGRKAYAYFTFRRDKTLTDIAQKRLSAIREFTAFGSGFRIAMRDLQIRGAGSLLGHSQHGHMEAVGYDLYVKMLGQAIAQARGEPVQRDKSDCLVDLRVDAFIPEKYIPDGAGRIEAYKRIAAIQTPEDAADVLDELIDRYGDPPPSVSDLVNVSLVRVQAAAVGVYEVTQKKDTLMLNLETLDLAMIRGLLQAFNGRVTAGAGTKPYLSVVLQPDEKPLELLQNILKAMADILTGTEREKAPQTGGAGTRKRD